MFLTSFQDHFNHTQHQKVNNHLTKLLTITTSRINIDRKPNGSDTTVGILGTYTQRITKIFSLFLKTRILFFYFKTRIIFFHFKTRIIFFHILTRIIFFHILNQESYSSILKQESYSFKLKQESYSFKNLILEYVS